MSQQLELYIYSFIEKLYVELLQNGKNFYLISVRNIGMWIYRSLLRSYTIALLFEVHGRKGSRNFWDFHVTSNALRNSVREIIINCIATEVFSQICIISVECFEGNKQKNTTRFKYGTFCYLFILFVQFVWMWIQVPVTSRSDEDSRVFRVEVGLSLSQGNRPFV